MILGALAGHAQTIEIGAIYRRCGSGSLVEVARVLEVGPDKMGIPHVRYELHVASSPSAAGTTEVRTLALEAFQNRFRERVRER